MVTSKKEMRKQLLQQFDQTTGKLIQLLSGLSEDQLNKIPFEGSWTAGQVGDHLLKAYGAGEILTGNTRTTERPMDEKIGNIRKLFLNFDIKMKSPRFIIPTKEWIDKQELLKKIGEKTGVVIELLNDPDFDLSLTCLDFELPGSGTLTRSEWIQFMTVHTQRHVHQLKKIIKNLNSD